MDLIIWRHAEAYDTSPDITRELTPKGYQQADIIARWLKPRLPKNTRVLVSPATRAQQTANALDLPFETYLGISPSASAEGILTELGWPEAEGSVLIVGHQPTLGVLAAMALTGSKQYWCIKKANLWWLSSKEKVGARKIVLKAVVAPNMVSDEI